MHGANMKMATCSYLKYFSGANIDRWKQLAVRGRGCEDRSSVREFARCSIYTVNYQCQ